MFQKIVLSCMLLVAAASSFADGRMLLYNKLHDKYWLLGLSTDGRVTSQVRLGRWTPDHSSIAVGEFPGCVGFDVPFTRMGKLYLMRFDTAGNRGLINDYGFPPDGHALIVGIGDFDQNGADEMILQNPTTKSLMAAEVDSLNAIRYFNIQFPGGFENFTDIIGIADMNNDGRSDIVLQDPDRRSLRYLHYGGLDPISISEIYDPVALHPDPDYSVQAVYAGVFDVDGNGTGDIITFPPSPRKKRLWLMNGTTRISADIILGNDDGKLKWELEFVGK